MTPYHGMNAKRIAGDAEIRSHLPSVPQKRLQKAHFSLSEGNVRKGRICASRDRRLSGRLQFASSPETSSTQVFINIASAYNSENSRKIRKPGKMTTIFKYPCHVYFGAWTGNDSGRDQLKIGDRREIRAQSSQDRRIIMKA